MFIPESRILIFTHPGSRIRDPKTATETKFVVITFYVLCFYEALKNMDLGSGIRKKPIPDPGSRGQKGTGSWIADPDPQHSFRRKLS
jgi:hypothetical protein